jgi:hypothetical protein
MSLPRTRYHMAIAASIIITVILFTLFQSQPSFLKNAIHSTTTNSRSLNARDKRKINNATLGFAHIYALGLPARTDRRDGLDLAATLTNLTLTWRDGVNGTTMHEKAKPPPHNDGSKILDAAIGSWRGHMNMMREIVTSGVGSALILEDDADWDVSLRSQMEDLAVAVRETISLLPEQKRDCNGGGGQDSPYGACWDLLWIGHCGGWGPNDHHHAFQSLIRGDSTVPPLWDISDLLNDVGEPCTAHVGRKLPNNVVCQSPSLQGDERIVSICAFIRFRSLFCCIEITERAN